MEWGSFDRNRGSSEVMGLLHQGIAFFEQKMGLFREDMALLTGNGAFLTGNGALLTEVRAVQRWYDSFNKGEDSQMNGR